MKPKFILVLCAFLVLSAIALLAQIPESAPPAPAVNPEESLTALLKAMFFQVLKSPASLLVIIGLSIIAVVVEVVEWIPSNPVKIILPLCVFGGAATYWLFSPASSVDKHFPHPHAVLVVNGLICGLVAFIAHVRVVKYLIPAPAPKPPVV
jgi:hypothetical protein